MKQHYGLMVFLSIIFTLILVPKPNLTNSSPSYEVIRSYWAQKEPSLNSPSLSSWNDAGKKDFVFTISAKEGVQGRIYVKNSATHLYVAIRFNKSIQRASTLSNSSGIRLNFDANYDRVWAEDSKGLWSLKAGDSAYDLYFLPNNPSALQDPRSSPDFIGKISTVNAVTELGTSSDLFFQFKIPLSSSEVLYDLYVTRSKGYILGFSMDFFYGETTNGTWLGGSFPNFADSSSYATLVLAGSGEVAGPSYDPESPDVTETAPSTDTSTTSSTTGYPDYPTAAGGGADSFDIIGALAALFGFILIRSRIRRSRSSRK